MNPSLEIHSGLQCYRILMFTDANFTAHVWSLKGDLWLCDRNQKFYDTFTQKNSLSWLLTAWNDWQIENFELAGRHAGVTRREKIQQDTKKAAAAGSKGTTGTATRKRNRTNASYTTWHSSSIGQMKSDAAKAKFHYYGKNKAISTTSYNAIVKRVAEGETDLMETLEDLGRLNVRVVTTGNGEPAKNALGKQLSTKVRSFTQGELDKEINRRAQSIASKSHAKSQAKFQSADVKHLGNFRKVKRNARKVPLLLPRVRLARRRGAISRERILTPRKRSLDISRLTFMLAPTQKLKIGVTSEKLRVLY
jgi:hypothetical protein